MLNAGARLAGIPLAIISWTAKDWSMIPNPLKKDEGNENACEDNDKRSELVHSFTLKAIGESNVGGDGRSMVRELSKKSRGVKPRHVPGGNNVLCRRPPNFYVSLITQISHAAPVGWVNQSGAAKGIDSILRRFPPVPVPADFSPYILPGAN